jgi:hypothetical protein
MTVEGTVEELKDLQALIAKSRCANIHERIIKTNYSELISDAIKDAAFENHRNYLFTTTEDF